ncbi:sensor histidine kinase [Sphingomonas quercus]|uniref:Histidine kinase n=1 Tax=Sphingomonas quercus TaxID=2842451 RepID=A0ABS6BK37_9SPHN|nr:histidine kinase [Sphingomonas quercus]MBU3077811.1 histidine kinase [Sphingomonas quercus]
MKMPLLDIYWRRAVMLTVALWLFVGLTFLPILVERHLNDDWTSIALDFSTVFLSMVLAMPLFAIFRATQDWATWQRAVVIAASVAGVSVFQTILDFQFTRFVASNFKPSWAEVPQDLSRFYSAIYNYVCAYGVNVALFNLSLSRIRTAEQERDLVRARSAAQQAQLAALRFQLNPHFLFNTLNAISAMIVTRRNHEAEAMTEKLCAFLRASLDADPNELVAVEEELALLEDYLDIESVRFGERLVVVIDSVPEASEMLVPNFLLQPLVENAVKYGVSRSREPVTIRIGALVDAGKLILSVEDDAIANNGSPDAQGTATGLTNVRRRLEALYGTEGALVAGPGERGFRAVLTLPAKRAD